MCGIPCAVRRIVAPSGALELAALTDAGPEPPLGDDSDVPTSGPIASTATQRATTLASRPCAGCGVALRRAEALRFPTTPLLCLYERLLKRAPKCSTQEKPWCRRFT